MYNNLIFNSDALGVLLEDILVGGILVVGVIFLGLLVLHLCASFFGAFFALIIDPKNLFFMRDTRDYKDRLDWLPIYLGVSMWTWLCVGIGFIILIIVKLLFAYGVLRFQ